jgi:hypothetical protein
MAKITLQKPSVTLDTDISGSITLTIPSNLNAWKSSDKAQGAAATSYSLDDLPKYIYLEGKTASGAVLDTAVKAEMTLNSGVKCRDEIKYTVIELHLKEVSLSGTKYHTIKKDDNTIDFSAPHWQDNSTPLDGDTDDSGDRNYPVSYTSSSSTTDSYMKAAVKIYSAPASFFSNTMINADNSGGYNFSDTGKITGTELSFNSGDVQCSKKFAVEMVDYYKPLTLTWKVSVDGGTKWFDAGVSDINAVYVTWKDPTPGTLWETPLKIGCEKAKGNSQQPNIISSIFSEFTDCVVTRVDGVQMTYWKGGNPTQSLQGMLADSSGDGSCIAWSQLLHWCMESQGIGTTISQVWTIDPDTSVNPLANIFLIKNWNFGLHIRTGTDAVRDSTVSGDDVAVTPIGINTPCILPGDNGILDSTVSGNDITQDGLYSGTNYPYEIDKDAHEQNRINAQGNPASPRYFYNHWVCKINGSIYDPSYGVGPKTETEHENEAIDGIGYNPRCKKDNNSIKELLYTRDTGRE